MGLEHSAIMGQGHPDSRGAFGANLEISPVSLSDNEQRLPSPKVGAGPSTSENDESSPSIINSEAGPKPCDGSACFGRGASEVHPSNTNGAKGLVNHHKIDPDPKCPDQHQYPEKDFEVSWEGDHDPMNPESMGKARKWLIVAIASTSSTCVTCASSLYTSTYAQLEKDLHCSEIVATLGLSIFVMGLGLGPMLLGPLSEFYGRRYIYIVSFTLFLVWLIPCAIAQNMQTMLVARFFDGVAGSAFLSVAGGTVGDMFSRNELQTPMMIFTASPFIGPPVGPLLGDFINQFADWRWSFYVLLIWAAVMLALITLFIPETYHPVLLRRKAIKLRIETSDERWHAPIEKRDKSILQTVIRSCYRPFMLLALEPMCLNLCIFSAILLGILYLWFGAFNLVFEDNHDFEQWQVGLTYMGIFAGILIAIASGSLWHRNYIRLVENREKEGGQPGGSEPEYRLPPAIGGAILVPIGLFWYV